MTIDEILESIQSGLDLEAETEHDVLEEIRGHLEDAVAAARDRGLDERQSLSEAAARFGVDNASPALQDVHLGWGTADGVIAAALPVICALILRWMVFSPDGSAVGWQEVLVRPTFWAVTLISLLVPILRFPRWRYALASWAVFWVLSVASFAWPAERW